MTAEIQHDFWPRAVQAPVEIMAPRLALDEWASLHRVIVTGARRGRWNPKNAPMAIEPMRALSSDDVRSVIVISPSQLLKTELAVNTACWTSDYGDDCLFYEPDQPLLEKMLADRVRPSLVAMGRLLPAGHGSATTDAHKKRDHRMEIRPPGRGAITGLSPLMKTGRSAHTARVVIIDELDKMGLTEMMVVARERVTTYGRDAKILVVTTPTIDALGTGWREWTKGSRGVWMGRCPKCRNHVSMDWDRVDFARDDAGLWLPDTASLVCESCKVRWTEAQRMMATEAGCYVHEDPGHEQRTFRIPGPAHLWRPLADIVEQGAENYAAGMETQDWSGYIAWWNGMVGKPWNDEFRGLSARGLAETTFVPGPRGAGDLGEIPAEVLLITAGADVGQHHIKCEWVGWGIDPETDRIRSWGLRYAVIGDGPDDSIDEPDMWDDFDREVRNAVWRRPGGGEVRVSRVLIDRGHKPEVIQSWCTHRYRKSDPKRMDFFGAEVGPVRGHNAEDAQIYPVNLEIGTRRKKGRSVLVPATVFAMTQRLKEELYDWLAADKALPPGTDRAHQYPAGGEVAGYSASYFKELAGELKEPYRTRQGRPRTRWVSRHGFQRHDAWDCRVYALAALYVNAYPAPLAKFLRLRRQRLAKAGPTIVAFPKT